MLSLVLQDTQISSLPMRDNEYGPTNLVAFGDDALFQATNPRTGRQAIWITDGTATETKPLRISLPGDELLVGVSGEQIFFAVPTARVQGSFGPGASLEALPANLYVTTNLGKSFTALGLMPAGIGFGNSATVGNEFFYTVTPVFNSGTLWETDGTKLGTHVVDQVGAVDYATGLVPFGNYLLLASELGPITSLNVNSFQTQQIATDSGGDPVMFGGYAYFTQNGDLSRTDGTIEGTVDLYAGAASRSALPNLTFPGGILAVGDKIYLFAASELYACSGTVDTIVPVAPLPSYSSVTAIAFDGDAVFNWKTHWATPQSGIATEQVLAREPPYLRMSLWSSRPQVRSFMEAPLTR